jgi:hypothetical protein
MDHIEIAGKSQMLMGWKAGLSQSRTLCESPAFYKKGRPSPTPPSGKNRRREGKNGFFGVTVGVKHPRLPQTPKKGKRLCENRGLEGVQAVAITRQKR